MPYQVQPMNTPVNTKVRVPGSKSITNRALLMAALAEGHSTLEGVLVSDDSEALMNCFVPVGGRA